MVRTALGRPPSRVLEEAQTALYDKIVATSSDEYEDAEYRAEAVRLCIGQMTCPMAVEFLQRTAGWVVERHPALSYDDRRVLHRLAFQIEGKNLVRPKESLWPVLLPDFVHRAQRTGEAPGPLLATLLLAAVSVMPKIRHLRAIEASYDEFLSRVNPPSPGVV